MTKPKKKSNSARNLAKMIWQPKPGDRVWLPLKDKPALRAVVSGVSEGYKCHLKGIEGDYLSGQLAYRPTPSDYDKILEVLAPLFVFIENTSKSHYMTCLKVNEAQVYLKGRARKILKSLLDFRVVDTAINVAVNDLVNSKYQGVAGGTRIFYSQPSNPSPQG